MAKAEEVRRHNDDEQIIIILPQSVDMWAVMVSMSGCDISSQNPTYRCPDMSLNARVHKRILRTSVCAQTNSGASYTLMCLGCWDQFRSLGWTKVRPSSPITSTYLIVQVRWLCIRSFVGHTQPNHTQKVIISPDLVLKARTFQIHLIDPWGH